ncbi:hypothetical protein [Dyella japonica]|uniref:Uncharacterized protein n=1 Tax=Dyella japonica A8 TaxID=1217721 RepID=A0A075K5L5_9GAMM|nr:hypothetical protein [Dyella japonica]AIF49439.1 hypothetical protein HY57_20325 [Dyella japonica A8]
MEQGKGAIESGLRRIRIRRWVSYGLFVGWLPCGIAVSKVTSSGKIDMTLALVYMVAILISGVMVGFSICPRCKQYFFMGTYTNTFSAKCMNCGLPLSGE